MGLTRGMRITRLAMLLLIAAVTDAPAAGRFNLPISLRQCLGVGFGPGLHAPLTLGPAMRAGTEAQRLKRLPAAPRPTVYSSGFVGQSASTAPVATPMGWGVAPGHLPATYPAPARGYGVAPTPAPPLHQR